MKTILVPTDFSEAARNAEKFAAALSNDIPGSRVILLNAYDRQGYGSDGTPIQLNETAERNIAEAALNNHRIELQVQLPGTSIETLALPGGLLAVLDAAIADSGATLVVMGINHSSRLDQVLVGSSTVNLVRKASLPVLIVPEGVAYRPLKNVVFATDLQDTEHSTPAAFLNELVHTFTGRLDVVHVGESSNSDGIDGMSAQLHDSAPVFHFLYNDGFAKTLNGFIEREKADVLVLVSRKHDFFERVFKNSHTKNMAYNAGVPVIAVPDVYCAAPGA